MLICFPWKWSGGGVVYGCGVWKVKSWVKNVLNTNKYIAISPIKWGWSRLTYLPLVVIISEKSIILFYWTPYRGIETPEFWQLQRCSSSYWTPYRGIETFWQCCGCSFSCYWTPYRGIETHLFCYIKQSFYFCYWTPYRGIETSLLTPYFCFFAYWTPYRGIETMSFSS